MTKLSPRKKETVKLIWSAPTRWSEALLLLARIHKEKNPYTITTRTQKLRLPLQVLESPSCPPPPSTSLYLNRDRPLPVCC
ncbi:hypothetical protein QVD17_21322 [Tagetes erecta]|uniref:Reelin domain-containing protein n=1 Tax=Tagetes erecta TaxID=13708 RepID=A0AAD8NSX4_TARER|nr:hypothetical protein QVD17_21322 [Tagetes erecta]